MDKLLSLNKKLNNDNLKIIVMKDKKYIFKSRERGIKPLYLLYKNFYNESYNSIIADKVIGSGAARILVDLEIRAIYTEVISKEALEILKKAKIVVKYEKITENILNRAKNDLCPIEKISKKSKKIDKLINDIEKFLNENNLMIRSEK